MLRMTSPYPCAANISAANIGAANLSAAKTSAGVVRALVMHNRCRIGYRYPMVMDERGGQDSSVPPIMTGSTAHE
jgi:hypothetical protein